MPDEDSPIGEAVRLRLEYNRVVRSGTQTQGEESRAAVAWLDAEGRLSVDQYVDYMKRYRWAVTVSETPSKSTDISNSD